MLHLLILDAAVAYTNLHEIAFVTAHAIVRETSEHIALIAYGHEAQILASADTGAAMNVNTDCSLTLANNEVAFLVNSAEVYA